MTSFEVKIAKANTIIWFQKHQWLTNLFRVIEILTFMIMIIKYLTQYPFFVIRFSMSDHFKGLSFAVFSPRFVFVIGNLIILILLFESRVIENGERNEKTDNVYDEYVKTCEKRVVSGNSNNNSNSNSSNVVTSNKKRIFRTRSENMTRVEYKQDQTNNLRRSVTERKIEKKNDCGGGDMVGPEKRRVADELSNDEFRRTVEAFIARQQQSLRDEELAPVPYIGA
ncbi:uncharacterized protein [Rutidosis leptorrhynchoides]|uniref:uncharacterized protein n=1 Tax=Rutidosis leptorrhynchoides TaxID=125765 RepID=UPI003A992B5F